MDTIKLSLVYSRKESLDFDRLLWKILWKPIGLPRDFRDLIKFDGDILELVAKLDGKIIGGIVAGNLNNSNVEIRHIAIKQEFQNKGIGRSLVTSLFSIASALGCSRINTIARNTSKGFFKKLNFRKSSGTPPIHPDFRKHGISFELMTRSIKKETPRK
jgi:GNAT superfamily N-acetyltransferase